MLYYRYSKNIVNYKEVKQMYEYIRGSYIYRGGQGYGSPVREIKTISEKEAKYWDRIEKQIREQERGKIG